MAEGVGDNNGPGPRVGDRRAMIAAMRPLRHPGRWFFCTVAPASAPPPAAIATFREREGLSCLLAEADAAALGADLAVPLAHIELQVHSALEGVGLTAAVSGALAAHGIAANIVAANHHDHVFVPERDAARAMAVLIELQEAAASAD